MKAYLFALLHAGVAVSAAECDFSVLAPTLAVAGAGINATVFPSCTTLIGDLTPLTTEGYQPNADMLDPACDCLISLKDKPYDKYDDLTNLLNCSFGDFNLKTLATDYTSCPSASPTTTPAGSANTDAPKTSYGTAVVPAVAVSIACFASAFF